MTMDYEYDVFISYRNSDKTINWVKEFEDLLRYWLKQELGGNEPRIFFDKDSIDTGTIWPNELKNGLKNSKILICIWTPDYFKSNWCISEWKSFEEREKLFQEYNISLIFPIRFHDGEHYPQEARNRQCFDVRDYSSTRKIFWESMKAVELEEEIKKFCKKIAARIKLVPSYKDDFPVIIENKEHQETLMPHIKL